MPSPYPEPTAAERSLGQLQARQQRAEARLRDLEAAQARKLAPRACFRVAPTSSDPVAEPFQTILGRALRKRFEATRWPMFTAFWIWVLLLKAERGSLPVLFWRSNFVVDNWILEITPSHRQTALGPLLFGSDDSSGGPMPFMCSEIHEVLMQIPTVTEIRWYFQDRNSQSTAFATPGELQWMKPTHRLEPL